jgi:hypothetical protein
MNATLWKNSMVIASVDALNLVETLMEVAGVRCRVMVLFVIEMSHEVMSDAGRNVPVAPFVVIDPVTAYGFVMDG